jgi:acyl carrier protein
LNSSPVFLRLDSMLAVGDLYGEMAVKSSLREALRHLLSESYGLTAGEFDESTALFSSRLLDSFTLVELVSFIEKREGVRFNASAFRLDNFDSIDKMVGAATALKGVEV